MSEEVRHYHYQLEQRYKVVFERASTKGVDGFKVEANGDDLEDTSAQAEALYEQAKKVTSPEAITIL